jgi:uncharacterized protein YegL
MSDLEIGNAAAIHWLWLVIFVSVVGLLAIAWARRSVTRFASPELIDRFFSRRGRWRNMLSLLLMSLVMALLVVCLVDLRWGQVQREIPQKGIEVMFVLDVSRSMLAEDVAPNRLRRAKQMIADTMDEMIGDRVGLVIFAGEARQQIPLTSHYEDFKQTLDEITPGDLMRGGSRLGEAIRVARNSFLSKTNEHRAMVLLTDGEDQESNPVEEAIAAKAEQGVRIFTIGLGDLESGARIPIGNDDRDRGFVEHNGEQVWSKLNGEILTKIATVTDGAYIPAGTKQVNMADVYHGYIANVEQTEFETAKVNSLEARFQWFLLPAILLLLIETALQSRPRH